MEIKINKYAFMVDKYLNNQTDRQHQSNTNDFCYLVISLSGRISLIYR